MNDRQLTLIQNIVGTDYSEGKKIYPSEVAQIMELVKLANKEGIPVYPFGSGSIFYKRGTSSAQGLMISLSKLNKFIEYRPNNLSVEVEAGVTTGMLAEKLGQDNIFYPIETCSPHSTIGGQVAVNKYDRKKYLYKSTRFHVLGLELVSPQGELIRVGGKTFKNVSGYDISQMLAGSWGSFGIITKVTLKVRPKPEKNLVLDLLLGNIAQLAEKIEDILKEKLSLASLTFTNQEGRYVLHVELEGFENTLEMQGKYLKEKYGCIEGKGKLKTPEIELNGKIAVPIADYPHTLRELDLIVEGKSNKKLLGNATNGIIQVDIKPELLEEIKVLVERCGGVLHYNNGAVTQGHKSKGYLELLQTIKKQVDPNHIFPFKGDSL